MRLCILGNSHTGSLKRAWDNLVESAFKQKIEIDFFASRGKDLEGLTLDGESLVPMNERLKSRLVFTSNGLSSIDLTKYDIFLIYGLGLKPYFTNDYFYSIEVIERSLRNNYQNSLGYSLLTMICSTVDSKVYLGHSPLPANYKQDDVKLSSILSEQYIKGVNLANNKVFLKLNGVLLHQPKQTLVGNNRNTHSRFSKGSKKLDIGDHLDSKIHRISDNRHMNDEYGRIWLESFLILLDSVHNK